MRTLDAVADTFLTQNVERQSAQAEQSLNFLEAKTPELRGQLRTAEERLNKYRTELDSVDLSSEAQAAVERYIDIERRLNELEFQEAELAQRYTASHPSYQTLLRQKRHLQTEKGQLNDRVNELPAAQQEVLRLTRDVEVTQAIYVNVLNKVQELQVAKAGTIGNIRIIDRAEIQGLVAHSDPASRYWLRYWGRHWRSGWYCYEPCSSAAWNHPTRLKPRACRCMPPFRYPVSSEAWYGEEN